jgi:hypothetical protein
VKTALRIESGAPRQQPRCNLAEAAPQPAGQTLAGTDRDGRSAITKEPRMKRVEDGRRMDGQVGARLKRRTRALLTVTVRREPSSLHEPCGLGAWWSR